MSKRAKYIAGTLLGVVLLAAVLLFVNGPRMAAGVKNVVLAKINESVNGRVEAGDVSFSVLGEITVSQVAATDLQNKLIASGDKVVIKYDFDDLLRGNFGLGAGRGITVTGLKMTLVQQADDSWNIENFIKKPADGKDGRIGRQPADELAFRGQLTITGGAVDVVSANGTRKIEGINGTLNFAAYPALSVQDFTALFAGQKVLVKGQIILPGPQLKLTINSAAFDCGVISPDLPLQGTARLNMAVEGTLSRPVVEGSAEIAQGDFAAIPFSGAAGAFHYADKLLTLRTLSGNVYGGAVSGTGAVVPDSRKYKMSFSGDNLDAAVLTDRNVEGAAKFNADIDGAGSFANAYAAGNFRLGAGVISGVPFTWMTGQFEKQGSKLLFSNVVLEVAGREIKADAVVVDGGKVQFKLRAVDNAFDNVRQKVAGKITDKLPLKLP